MTVQEMIEAHPQPTSLNRDALLRCIDECFDCAATCTSCADACLGEQDVQELVRCIRLNLDCADACNAAGRILTRQTAPDVGVLRAAIQACAAACRACGEECERHAEHHEHCRVCSRACRRCEQACKDVLAAIGSPNAIDDRTSHAGSDEDRESSSRPGRAASSRERLPPPARSP